MIKSQQYVNDSMKAILVAVLLVMIIGLFSVVVDNIRIALAQIGASPPPTNSTNGTNSSSPKTPLQSLTG
jgi:hypothetical protein